MSDIEVMNAPSGSCRADSVPTIQYGGYFLLTSLMDKGSGYMENPLRQNFF